MKEFYIMSSSIFTTSFYYLFLGVIQIYQINYLSNTNKRFV